MAIQENHNLNPEVLEQVVEAIGPEPILSPQEQAMRNNYLAMRQFQGKEEAELNFHQMFGDEAEQILQLIDDWLEWQRQYKGIVFGGGVIGGPDEEDWYVPDLPPFKYWRALKESLSDDPNWRHAVDSIDESSNVVVSKLGNPSKQAINTRGLVVGYVQSGKTANYSATIAKAADRGYKLFIILSGMHTGLRRQTQRRMTKDLVHLNPENWIELTSENNDIGDPGGTAWLMQNDKVGIAVVKKHSSRLKRLNAWLKKAEENNHLQNAPILIIDDECDQASPNAHKSPEESRTAINDLIVELLTGKRATYVGYTASPFANFVVNPMNVNDIYPRNFIIPLPKPEGYFGGEELFGLHEEWSEGELYGEVLPEVFREVTPEEAELYKHTADNFVPQVGPELNNAILWFILATATRLVRNDGQMMHSSMLMHTTHNVLPHLQFGDLLRDHIKGIAEVLSDSFGKKRFKDLWEREIENVPAEDFGLTTEDFEAVYSYVPEVLSKLVVVVDNSQSNDRLDYEDNDPKAIIVVGGNTLSRGLTLEGLVCSFFLRNGRQYDSLMQMGRWYGYRPGYGDLARIWTTKTLRDHFSFLAHVEADIRQQLQLYAQGDGNPLTVPVQVLRHSAMQMTARNKLFFAVTAAPPSFSGRRIHTLYLNHRDNDVAQNNLLALKTLLAHSGNGTEYEHGGILFKDIDSTAIQDFITSYSFAKDGEAQGPALTNYIKEQNDHDRILKWNVLVSTPKQRNDRPIVNLGDSPNLSQVITTTRSPMNNDFGSTDFVAYLKGLDDKKDRIADWPSDADTSGDMTEHRLLEKRNEIGNALLIIYVIDKDSTPKPPAPGKQVRRKKLEAIDHQIALSFAFPSAHEDTEIPDAFVVDSQYLPEFELEGAEDDDIAVTDDDGDQNLPEDENA